MWWRGGIKRSEWVDKKGLRKEVEPWVKEVKAGLKEEPAWRQLFLICCSLDGKKDCDSIFSYFGQKWISSPRISHLKKSEATSFNAMYAINTLSSGKTWTVQSSVAGRLRGESLNKLIILSKCELCFSREEVWHWDSHEETWIPEYISQHTQMFHKYFVSDVLWLYHDDIPQLVVMRMEQ